MQNQIDIHRIELDDRKKISVSGVSSLDGFSEQVLNLTVNGRKLKVLGENIKITAYNKSTGNLVADGVFNEIKYCQQATPFIKKLFK